MYIIYREESKIVDLVNTRGDYTGMEVKKHNVQSIV